MGSAMGPAIGTGIGLALSALVITLAPACTRGNSAPTHLLDGSKAPQVPVALEGVGGTAVLTKSRQVPFRDIVAGSLADACVREWARGTRPMPRVVERVGVITESVTIRSGSNLYGCDNSQGARERNRRWCGMSFGTLYGGRLRDPRLDVLCTTTNGSPVGFLWVEPSRSSSYVVVRQKGFAEVYEATGGLPVRLATTEGVSIETFRASIDVSEHDERGRLIRRYVLEALVAG